MQLDQAPDICAGKGAGACGDCHRAGPAVGGQRCAGQVGVLERATLKIDNGDRPGCVACARDLPGRMVGVDDIHHVRRLRELDVGELGVEIGRRHLDRAATRYNRAPILVDSKILVAELQDIGLLDIELEGDQPDVVCAVLDLADEDRARPPACAAMRVDDKFSSVLQPLKYFWMSVRPSRRGLSSPAVKLLKLGDALAIRASN